MITALFHGAKLGEYDSPSDFVRSTFNCAFDEARRLVLSGDALRRYVGTSQTVTTHSYGCGFTLTQAIGDWAQSSQGKECLRQLNYEIITL
jgi:hypothetical protein